MYGFMWFGHFVRVDQTVKAYKIKIETSRGRERPCRRRIEGVSVTLGLDNTIICQTRGRAPPRAPSFGQGYDATWTSSIRYKKIIVGLWESEKGSGWHAGMSAR